VSRVHTFTLLALVIVAGGVLRFAGLNWDPGNSFHCDERNVIGPAVSVRADRGFHPSFFAYGSLPIYLMRATGELIARAGLAPRGNDWRLLKVIGRGVSALCSTLCIVMAYLIAARLFDRRVALLSAAFCAFSVLMIQNAHFGTVESMLTLWLLGAVYAACGIAEQGSWRSYVLFGVFAGLGLATKTSGLSFFALLAGAQLIRMASCRKYEIGPALLPAVVFVVAVVAVLVLWPEAELSRVRLHMNAEQPYSLPERVASKLLQGGAAAFQLWAVIGAMAVAALGFYVLLRWPEGRPRWGWAVAAACVGGGVLVGLVSLIDAGNFAWVRASVLYLVAAALAAAGGVAFVVSRRGVSCWVRLFGAAVIAFAIGFAGWPWAVLGLHDQAWARNSVGMLRQIRFEAGVVSGTGSVAWTEMSHHALPYGYTLAQMFLWTLGPPLGAMAILGFGFAVWRAACSTGGRRIARGVGWILPLAPAVAFRLRYPGADPYVPLPAWVTGLSLGLAAMAWAVSLRAVRDERRGRGWLLLLAWAFPYFLLIGAWRAKFVRYTAPLVPVLCIFGAGVLVWLWGRFRGRVARGVIVAAGAVGVAGAAFYSVAFLQIYVTPSTRIKATQWMYRHMPAGARVLQEPWEERLPAEIPNAPRKAFDMALGDLNARYLGDPTAERFQIRREPGLLGDGAAVALNERKLNYMCEALSSGDYALNSCIPVGQKYPIVRLYYRLLYSGQLGYTLAARVTSYPRLFGLEIVDDAAEESFVGYDHPRIDIFANEERLSAEELERRFRNPPPELQPWNLNKAARASGT